MAACIQEECVDEKEVDQEEQKKLKKLKPMQESENQGEDDKKVNDLIDGCSLGEDNKNSISLDKRKRKRLADKFDEGFAEDDYDLIKENSGVKIARKKLKRVQRIVEQELEESNNESKEEQATIINGFTTSSECEKERISKESHSQVIKSVDNKIKEESEENGSIVDDKDQPKEKDRKQKDTNFVDASLQEAQDVFNMTFDFEVLELFGCEERVEEDYVPKASTKHQKNEIKKSVFEFYKPNDLRRGNFTDEDIEIQTNDIPERMQLRSVPVTSVPEGSDELYLEAKWIHEQAFCKPTISIQDSHLNDDAKNRARGRANGPHTVKKIKNALEFIRNQHLEVPFISFYRKEYVLPELEINDLWKVYKFDGKWCQLRQRKENLLILFKKIKNYQMDKTMRSPETPLDDSVRIIRDKDIQRLENAQTDDEINDIYQHFMFYYWHEVRAMQEAVCQKECEADKQPMRNYLCYVCKKVGLGSLIKRFGLTPEHFAENLRDNYQRHEVDEESAGPLAVASDYVGQKFTAPEEILKVAQLMVAIQLSREPLVRKTVMVMYMKRAKISVRPTKRGIKEIDENHPVYSMKYLKDKPVKDFVGDQFLKLVIAEKDGLIRISFSDFIEGNFTSNYIDEAKQLYHRDEFSKTVQDWNALRARSVEMALTKIVLPGLKKKLKIILVSEAKECVMRVCCQKIYNWLKTAPYYSCEFINETDEEWDISNGLRVMGVAYLSDQSQAPYACIISPDGKCTDFLKISHILKLKNSCKESENIFKEVDLLAIKNFIETKKPHLVVIGGETPDALMVQTDIRDIVLSLVDEEHFPNIQVEICDNELAKMYANSNKGISEFRDYSPQLRQAISLARRMQDPLLEFSQLCTADNEILCLKYHSLQDQLPPEDLLENIYLEFVNRVNEVGVDINKAVQQAYFSNIVQFICGLGRCKGAALLKILKQSNQRLENRTQLITVCYMGPKVFINCAGFIKIDTNSLRDSTVACQQILDGSRVHPESYEWAKQMAVDALEYEDKVRNTSNALKDILETPDKLKDLDLDAFAKELDRQGFGNKSITLHDIREELNSRYKDLRMLYWPPDPEKLFNILTKETSETFHTRKLIVAKVVGFGHSKQSSYTELHQANPVNAEKTGLWQCPHCFKDDFSKLSDVWRHFVAGFCLGKATGVRLRLDNGVFGYIHVKNLSDKYVADPKDRVQINQLVHCRIMKIDFEKFSVECTSKTSDLADKSHEFKPQKDPFYDVETEEIDLKQEEDAKKSKQGQTYIKRFIAHPSFHNISFLESEKLLKDMKQGDVIVWPSSKGADHLSISWKVTENVYQHIDVKEERKVNDFSLGSRLLIGKEGFGGLDEIIVRHVNPMAAFVSEILDFKYYQPDVYGMKDKAEELIKAQENINSAKIPYILSAAKNCPGKFLLSYLANVHFKHEYVSVTSKGFEYRAQIFSSLCDMLQWFKKHCRDPIPSQDTPSTSPIIEDLTPGTNHRKMASHVNTPYSPSHTAHVLIKSPSQFFQSPFLHPGQINTIPQSSSNPNPPMPLTPELSQTTPSVNISLHKKNLDSIQDSFFEKPQDKLKEFLTNKRRKAIFDDEDCSKDNSPPKNFIEDDDNPFTVGSSRDDSPNRGKSGSGSYSSRSTRESFRENRGNSNRHYISGGFRGRCSRGSSKNRRPKEKFDSNDIFKDISPYKKYNEDDDNSFKIVSSRYSSPRREKSSSNSYLSKSPIELFRDKRGNSQHDSFSKGLRGRFSRGSSVNREPKENFEDNKRFKKNSPSESYNEDYDNPFKIGSSRDNPPSLRKSPSDSYPSRSTRESFGENRGNSNRDSFTGGSRGQFFRGSFENRKPIQNSENCNHLKDNSLCRSFNEDDDNPLKIRSSRDESSSREKFPSNSYPSRPPRETFKRNRSQSRQHLVSERFRDRSPRDSFSGTRQGRYPRGSFENRKNYQNFDDTNFNNREFPRRPCEKRMPTQNIDSSKRLNNSLNRSFNEDTDNPFSIGSSSDNSLNRGKSPSNSYSSRPLTESFREKRNKSHQNSFSEGFRGKFSCGTSENQKSRQNFDDINLFNNNSLSESFKEDDDNRFKIGSSRDNSLSRGKSPSNSYPIRPSNESFSRNEGESHQYSFSKESRGRDPRTIFENNKLTQNFDNINPFNNNSLSKSFNEVDDNPFKIGSCRDNSPIREKSPINSYLSGSPIGLFKRNEGKSQQVSFSEKSQNRDLRATFKNKKRKQNFDERNSFGSFCNNGNNSAELDDNPFTVGSSKENSRNNESMDVS